MVFVPKRSHQSSLSGEAPSICKARLLGESATNIEFDPAHQRGMISPTTQGRLRYPNSK